MKLTKEQSQEQADLIMMARMFIAQMDKEYLDEVVKEMRRDASHYDATAALNRKWTEQGSELLYAQANQLQALSEFIRYGRMVDELRKKHGHETQKLDV